MSNFEIKIQLSINKCRHCNHWDFVDADGNFMQQSRCKIKNTFVNPDTDGCDKIELGLDIHQELKETLGFEECDIKLILLS